MDRVYGEIKIPQEYATRLLLERFEIEGLNDREEQEQEEEGIYTAVDNSCRGNFDEMEEYLQEMKIPYDLFINGSDETSAIKHFFRPNENIYKKLCVNWNGSPIIDLVEIENLVNTENITVEKIKEHLEQVNPKVEDLHSFKVKYLSNSLECLDLKDFISKLEDEIPNGINPIFDKGIYIEVYVNPDGIYNEEETSNGFSCFRYIDEPLTYEELLSLFDEGSLKKDTLTINYIPSDDEDYQQERELAVPISNDIEGKLNSPF
ncbi:MAG: hypothetical protein K0R54_173 [Clostridiaceae bacterium]|jgi:hypothetical protein|nr:hypothetical protein [Clostridiaceae bacterium]